MIAEDYIDRVSKKSNVWYGGQRVDTLTEHPAFLGSVSRIKSYYDLIDTVPEVYAAEGRDGPMAMSLLVPKSRTDLEAKRRAYKGVADLSYGMLGRTPDFMNAGLCALVSNSETLGADNTTNYAENARALYADCAKRNAFVSHAAINPQIDRSKTLGELNNTFAGVRVVEDRPDGIVVSGAKMIVTMGPLSDETAVFNMPGLRPEDDDFALAFMVPSNAEGLRFLCRNSTLRFEQSSFDRPLANAFDEMDALMILEEVFVPWNRVLIYRDVAKSNGFFDGLRIRHHTGHQGITRGLAKMEFVGGLAIRVADMLGLRGFLPVQQKLGEITSYVELTRSIIHNVEESAEVDEHGVWVPNSGPIQALRLQFPKWYRTAIETIQSLCAGSMMAVPCDADFSNENEDVLRAMFGSGTIGPRDRHALLNLAWDVTGTDFGQRQVVYENFHSGDPMRIAAGHLNAFDTSDMLSAADRALGVAR